MPFLFGIRLDERRRRQPIDLTGAELFKVGTWNGEKFTSADIDAIISSFNALHLSGRIPLKFGHNDEQPLTDGQPALGWVKSVYRNADTLFGDLTDVPKIVHDAIRAGRYKQVSIELLRNVKADTRVIPLVLDAVALLGADQPAVGTLKDLQALTMRRAAKLRGGVRVTFRRDVKLSGDRKIMNEDEVKKMIEQATAPLNKALQDADMATRAEFKRLNESAAQKDAEHKKQLASIHRERINERFNRAIEAGELLPAKRDQFTRLTDMGNDERVMNIKFEDVDQFISENKQATKLKRKDPTSGGGAADEDDEKGLRADQVVAKRAEKLCYSRNQDPKKLDHYTRAVTEVLRADATLAESYKYMPDNEYRPAA